MKKQSKEEQRKVRASETETDKIISRYAPNDWIKQPVNLTFMRGDIDRIQMSFIVNIMDRLQVKVNEWLSRDSAEKALSPNLFTKEEQERGMEPVRIPLSDLGVIPAHYNRLDAATDILAQRFVTVDATDEKGGQYVDKIPIFEKIRIPRKKINKNGEQVMQRESYVEVTLSRPAVSNFFQMNRYNRYIKNVVLNCKCRYTARIYLFLTAYKFSQKKQWVADYQDLRRILGLDEIVDFNQNPPLWKAVKYENYTDFRKRVLNDSKRELDEIAQRNEVDCYFDYEEVFFGGHRRGNPEKIIFKIQITDLGMQDSDRNARSYAVQRLIPVLEEYFGFGNEEASRIVDKIGDVSVDKFLFKIDELREYVRTKEGKISNVKAYAYSVLTEYLMDEQSTIVEVPNEPEEQKPGESGGVEEETQKEEMPLTNEQKYQQKQDAEKKYRSKVCGLLFERLGEATYLQLFADSRFVDYQNNCLAIKIQNSDFADIVRNSFMPQLMQAVKDVFGEETEVLVL